MTMVMVMRMIMIMVVSAVGSIAVVLMAYCCASLLGFLN